MRRVSRLVDFLPEGDLDSALGTHDGELRGWPGEVEVATDVLRTHHVVRPSVGLPRDDSHLGDRRLAVGVQELRAIADDPSVLLLDPRKEAGHVDEGEERDVEAIAEPDEPGRLDR